MRGNERKNKWVASNRLLGKRRWSRSSAAISAATARAGCRSPCAEKDTASVASACARPCAAGACTRCNPRLSRPAPPIRPTGCAAPPTGCSISPSPPRPTGSESAISRICRLPTASGLICAPIRIWSASRWSAGTRWPRCPKNWSPGLYSVLFERNRRRRACSCILTAVVPGRAGSTAATPTANCFTTTRPCARKAAGAIATTEVVG